jgi:methyl-accepting chemotaxis protein
MATIAAGAAEQSIGLAQVNAAMTRIDSIAQADDVTAEPAFRSAVADWPEAPVANEDRNWLAA